MDNSCVLQGVKYFCLHISIQFSTPLKCMRAKKKYKRQKQKQNYIHKSQINDNLMTIYTFNLPKKCMRVKKTYKKQKQRQNYIH